MERGNSVSKFTATAVFLTLLAAARPALAGEQLVLIVSAASKIRLDSLLDRSHPGWFTPGLARKDVRLAVDLAEQAGVAVRVGPATDALLTTVIDAGRPWPDFSAVIEAFG